MFETRQFFVMGSLAAKTEGGQGYARGRGPAGGSGLPPPPRDLKNSLREYKVRRQLCAHLRNRPCKGQPKAAHQQKACTLPP